MRLILILVSKPPHHFWEESFRQWSIVPSSNSHIETKDRLSIDPLFPPPDVSPSSKRTPPCDILPENKFYLVFDEKIDELQLTSYVGQYNKLNPPIVEMDEEEEKSSDSETEAKEDQ